MHLSSCNGLRQVHECLVAADIRVQALPGLIMLNVHAEHALACDVHLMHDC